MSKTFLTFGDGKFKGAVERITEQIKKIDLFDNIILYDENKLKECNDFWEKHSNFVLSNARGFGYWLWKPYLINKTLQNMNDGDILFYADAGCEINYNARDKMLQHLNRVNEVELMVTLASSEISWTKRDLLILLDADKKEYVDWNTPQYQATCLLIKKTEKTVQLIKRWYEICQEYKNIDDTPSTNKNYPEFIEHRHDQSVLSIVCKKYNMVNFELDPIYFDATRDYNIVKNYPIIAARNSQRKSIFNEKMEN